MALKLTNRGPYIIWCALIICTLIVLAAFYDVSPHLRSREKTIARAMRVVRSGDSLSSAEARLTAKGFEVPSGLSPQGGGYYVYLKPSVLKEHYNNVVVRLRPPPWLLPFINDKGPFAFVEYGTTGTVIKVREVTDPSEGWAI